MITALRAAGFDAMEGRSLAPVEHPEDPGAGNAVAREVVARSVYLPFRDDMPDTELDRMAEVVRGVDRPPGAPLTHAGSCG
jgi:hypothetical protein